ncbi:hypothetical protein CANMA_002670 [Candida margitis]|uniref:uncharacterized protein n=1 Tax=Candida margitis TaxID=1775924 RepID=UPI002226C2CF|nr:uncharacterized protein CANMA_002670 [Candida margitis]KAI5967902.1 hypothetical protein CANMA_002670 [Candida margitis]
MYDHPYHCRNKTTPGSKNQSSLRTTGQKCTPLSTSTTKSRRNPNPVVPTLTCADATTNLAALDDMFVQLQNILVHLETFTPIDVPPPYQISWKHRANVLVKDKDTDIKTSSNLKQVNRLNGSRRTAASSSRSIIATKQQPHHCISFESEFHKLHDHYRSLMQVLLAKNNDINVLKYKLNELVNTIALKFENLASFYTDEETISDDGESKVHNLDKSDVSDGNVATFRNAEIDESNSPSQGDNFERKMDEISRKLMEIFNPHEEFESVTVDSATIDSCILRDKVCFKFGKSE